jgi:hypothetical protein
MKNIIYLFLFCVFQNNICMEEKEDVKSQIFLKEAINTFASAAKKIDENDLEDLLKLEFQLRDLIKERGLAEKGLGAKNSKNYMIFLKRCSLLVMIYSFFVSGKSFYTNDVYTSFKESKLFETAFFFFMMSCLLYLYSSKEINLMEYEKGFSDFEEIKVLCHDKEKSIREYKKEKKTK